VRLQKIASDLPYPEVQPHRLVRCQCGWNGEEPEMVSSEGPLKDYVLNFVRLNALSVALVSMRCAMVSMARMIRGLLAFMLVTGVCSNQTRPSYSRK
jgi:hypothetical protein